MNKKWLALGLALVLMFTLVACGSSDDGDTEDPAPEVEDNNGEDTSSGEDLKVTMVTDEGGVNDQSFNQSAHEGLQDAEADLGIEIGYQESHQDADFVPNFETLLDAESDLIWGVGFKLADATYDAATNNPDTLYGIIDFSFDDELDEDGDPVYPDGTPDNAVGVLFRDEQSSFLVGYIAGKTTETDKVGFVGGIESDVIKRFESGYKAGVEYAAKELDKEIEIAVQYVDSFTDSGKGKAVATTMYQEDADVVFHAAGGAGDGVIEAAEEADKWVIGVDRDQNDMAPDHVLTSAMKRVDVAVYNVIEELIDDNFPGGETIVYGLEDEGAVDIAPTSDKNVDAEILDEIPGLKEEIIDGNIEVPYNDDTFEEFINQL